MKTRKSGKSGWKNLNFKERLKQLEYYRKQQILAYIIMGGMILGEFVALFWNLALSQRYIMGSITEEVFLLEQGKAMGFIGYYAMIYIIFLLFMGFWFKNLQLEYEKDEITLDSFEGPVFLDEFDRAIYLIQTDPDSSTEIKSSTDMLKILQNAEVYASLLKSIEADVEGFRYDQSNIFKQKFEKELAETAEKLREQKKAEEAVISTELPIDFLTVQKEELHAFFAATFPQVISDTVFAQLKTQKLFLYYRPIKKIRRVDDPTIDYDDEDSKCKDRLANITGFLALLPEEEKNYYAFPARSSPMEDAVILRKTYMKFHFKGFVIENTPLFVDSALLQTEKRVTPKGLADAQTKALTFLTHLSVERDQELRQEIQDKNVDIINLKRELDKKRDSELERIIHNGQLEHDWRAKYAFKKINATTIMMAVITLILGGFIGMVIW